MRWKTKRWATGSCSGSERHLKVQLFWRFALKNNAIIALWMIRTGTRNGQKDSSTVTKNRATLGRPRGPLETCAFVATTHGEDGRLCPAFPTHRSAVQRVAARPVPWRDTHSGLLADTFNKAVSIVGYSSACIAHLRADATWPILHPGRSTRIFAPRCRSLGDRVWRPEQQTAHRASAYLQALL